MKFTAKIRNNQTGETANYDHSFETIELALYTWREGKYSSNSNRAILFSWGGGGKLVKGEFSVCLIDSSTGDDGRVLLKEWE